MKVSQLRKLLAAAADQHDLLGRTDIGQGLRRLATALQSADKLEVGKAIQKLSG